MNNYSKVVASVIAFMFMSSVTSSGLAQQPDLNQSNPGCKNTAGAAAIGGLFGALVSKNNRAEGAAFGAIVSAIACLAMDASSKQTQSSSDALQEYQESHGGNMPTSVTLVNYSGNSPKSVSIENSGFVEIVSSGAVVVPAGQRSVPQYIEVLELKVPGEKPIISKRKISIAGGGGFEQSYKFTLTKEFPQGMYTYSTRVMTKGGQVLGERNGSFRVI